MAKKEVLIDDLDGSEGAETIRYAFAGQEYEIDLSEEHAEEFHAALHQYIDASRQVGRQPAAQPPPRRTRQRGTGGRRNIPKIRAWAASKGLEVSQRGRIKREIIEAYDQAHS